MKTLLKRSRSDRGDSELVSLIILLPLVLGVLFTMIDMSIYFSNRAIVQSAVRDASRTVAIMGGNGTYALGTPIEVKYGATGASACAGLGDSPVVKNAYIANKSTVIECHALQSYAKDSSLVNVTVTALTCSPTKTNGIGTKTECNVEWTYGSIPGSGMGFIHLGAENITVGTSESEVDMSNIPLVSR